MALLDSAYKQRMVGALVLVALAVIFLPMLFSRQDEQRQVVVEAPAAPQAPVVPHMGWNTVEAPAGTSLFEGVTDERFYFVHSYGVRDWTLVTNDRTKAPLVTWSTHGGDRFVAAVENGPLTATQFHPEKSGDAGAQLLRNWVNTL